MSRTPPSACWIAAMLWPLASSDWRTERDESRPDEPLDEEDRDGQAAVVMSIACGARLMSVTSRETP
jgi:hypothetical protein